MTGQGQLGQVGHGPDAPEAAALVAASSGGSPLHHDDYDDDDDGPSPAEGHDQDYDGNHTEVAPPLGSTLGGPCTNSCSPLLQNVRCSPSTHRCECGDLHPVEVSPIRGCTAPVGLGEQCLYQAACQHWDSHARCTQVDHNAVCQCEPGFHTVAVHKQGRRTFCSEDLVLLTADLPTLLGVATGIALFTGVICFVLRLFVGGRPRDHFANANLAPSHILFSSDTGLPLTGRSTSRSGSQRSVSGSLSRGLGHGGLGHGQGGQGGLGSSSRAGSRRQSTASVHSSASSTKSMGFGMRRYEREREQRLRRQQQQQQLQNPLGALAGLGGMPGLSGLQTPGSACSASGDELGLGGRSSRGASPSPGPSPNPLSPMSTDKLLPALDQLVEDVVWTTQSSSQRQDHMMAGPSGYRPLHLQRAEMRSERARQLHAQHAHAQHAQMHSAQLHAGHLQAGQMGQMGQLTRPLRDPNGGAGPSSAGPSSAGAPRPSTSSCTSPDGR
ncbi:uncharacterized protein LOC117649592 [Thrips palmi]|uniref:Uncharacterized protein LOC117649592 n=1 Tax=Thrips palmi TaxID=161013 RepID=A0A6P8ZSY3_THRPL|nr:uncharacterized protein LOC117649592 [Thrips palmi]